MARRNVNFPGPRLETTGGRSNFDTSGFAVRHLDRTWIELHVHG